MKNAAVENAGLGRRIVPVLLFGQEKLARQLLKHLVIELAETETLTWPRVASAWEVSFAAKDDLVGQVLPSARRPRAEREAKHHLGGCRHGVFVEQKLHVLVRENKEPEWLGCHVRVDRRTVATGCPSGRRQKKVSRASRVHASGHTFVESCTPWYDRLVKYHLY